MPREIGVVYSWKDKYIDIAITNDEYQPGIGDIYYVKLPNRYVLLQVVGFEGEIPVSTASIIRGPGQTPPLYSIQKTMIARAELFFEIRNPHSKPLVIKPNQPPPLEQPVYVLSPEDDEARKIMEILSKGIRSGGKTIPIAWLRSGIAPAEELRKEKYFTTSTLDLDLSSAVPKHFLVAGQTGAGKTTCVMGLIIQWARHSPDKIGWLIIDRHGEYGVTVLNGFIDILSKALKLNKKLDTLVRVYTFTTKTDDLSTNNLSDNTVVVRGNIDLSSISLYDVGNALDLSPDKISDLEEAIEILASIIKTIDENKLPEEWKNVFIDKESDQPTGQLLALLPLLVDNMFRYDGIGEREKKGIYKIMLNAGLDIRKLRTYRRLILSILGLSKKNVAVKTNLGERVVTVLDDSKSVFKISPILKDPLALVKLMKEMISAAQTQYNVDRIGNYPWRTIVTEPSIERLLEGNITIDKIAEKVNNGEVVVLDVSKIPIGQGDVVVMSIVRRLFESRMGLGVDMIKQLPPIAIVSEEAPLYLSPDKVRSPYNVFARIAREGRKFGLGLVAITQLATQIERQILANFNTIISLRTKYVSDINYFSNIGVPGEALTGLGDREGYLYTPDLRVKEPIPVYFPGYFEYAEIINNQLKNMEKKVEESQKKAVAEIFDDEGDDEI
ncbi:MAG: DUF87 domain-containing protein [Staphylothermus sp.]|nr:DUF87 domain-containing protein [Staphylothermus sp.]